MYVSLPEGYRLERDPDLIVLRDNHGRFVAAFSARGATRDAIEGAAREARRGVAASAPEDASGPGPEDLQGDGTP